MLFGPKGNLPGNVNLLSLRFQNIIIIIIIIIIMIVIRIMIMIIINDNDNIFCLPLAVLIYSIDGAEQMPETNISNES